VEIVSWPLQVCEAPELETGDPDDEGFTNEVLASIFGPILEHVCGGMFKCDGCAIWIESYPCPHCDHNPGANKCQGNLQLSYSAC
jgi:hypothetical protein